MDSNFGKYDVPPSLQKLMDLENSLGDSEHFYLGLHFYLALEDFRYFNTPSDVVVFGNIGADGIHYGFLTDYGSVTELEKAPIVCVSPMDFECPTRIVVNNLCEFLRVNLNDSVLFYNQFEDKEAYLTAQSQWKEEDDSPTESEEAIRKEITSFLSENLQLPIIEHPYQYVQSIEKERQRKVSVRTQDGLGVTAPFLPDEKHTPFLIHKDTDVDLKQLQSYLYTAPTASRLALFRDIQLYYVLQDE